MCKQVCILASRLPDRSTPCGRGGLLRSRSSAQTKRSCRAATVPREYNAPAPYLRVHVESWSSRSISSQENHSFDVSRRHWTIVVSGCGKPPSANIFTKVRSYYVRYFCLFYPIVGIFNYSIISYIYPLI